MQYWLAVVGFKEDADDFENRLWWCLPASAKKHDKVLIYCPRSVGFSKREGIFALCEVKTPPAVACENNYRCSGFGRVRSGKSLNLLYVELKFIKRFKSRLTAKVIKSNPDLNGTNFVRKNFQGTAFKLNEEIFASIIKHIELLEAAANNSSDLSKK